MAESKQPEMTENKQPEITENKQNTMTENKRPESRDKLRDWVNIVGWSITVVLYIYGAIIFFQTTDFSQVHNLYPFIPAVGLFLLLLFGRILIRKYR